MADHTVSIDVRDILVAETNPKLIPIIQQTNPVKGYTANAYTIRMLMQFGNLNICEAGTNKVITGDNYYDYFPEEDPSGGGGGGGGGGGSTGTSVSTGILIPYNFVDGTIGIASIV